MKELNPDDSFFHEIMSKSKLNVPFSDFDDNIIRLIDKRSRNMASIKRDIKFSWIFFILGSTFGISISLILPNLTDSVFGISPDKLSLLFLIFFSLIIVNQLNNLISSYKRRKSL